MSVKHRIDVCGQIYVFKNSFLSSNAAWNSCFQLNNLSSCNIYRKRYAKKKLNVVSRTKANKLSIFRFMNVWQRYTMMKHRWTPDNTARHFIFFKAFPPVYLKFIPFSVKDQFKLFLCCWHKQWKDSYTRYKIDGLSSLINQSLSYQLLTIVSLNRI